jgi:uncharacterized protein
MSANFDLIQLFLKKLRAGDQAGAMSHIHPEVVIDEPGSLPQSGEHRGHEAPLRLRTMITDLWDQENGAEHYLDAGEAVLMQRVVNWRAKRTGKAVRQPVLELYEFRDGMIARITVWIRDTKALAATLE